MKRTIGLLALPLIALALLVAPALANNEDGGGGGSEEIRCDYMPFPNPHQDGWPYHQFYVRSTTWGGHCYP